VYLLAEEQSADEQKKEYCNYQIDASEDKAKELARDASDLEASIEERAAAIKELTADIELLNEGVAALDKSVTEATAQRQQEHAEYKELMASDSAAKELLDIAKNRLNQFYNPSLYKPPAKTELSAESRIVSNMGNPDGIVTTTQPGGIANTGVTVFAQVSVPRQSGQVAPPPPPPTIFIPATPPPTPSPRPGPGRATIPTNRDTNLI